MSATGFQTLRSPQLRRLLRLHPPRNRDIAPPVLHPRTKRGAFLHIQIDSVVQTVRRIADEFVDVSSDNASGRLY